MLPAISQLLSSTVTENLKNILRPTTLFVATIFVFLHVAFVLIPLQGVDSQFGLFAHALLTMDSLWLTAVATVVIIIVGYVFNSLNSTIYRFMTGEAWKDLFVIGWLATRIQEFRSLVLRWRITLNDELNPSEASRLKYQLRMEFPSKKSFFAPTTLGNILNAHASILWERYNIDLTALWPHMQIVIDEKSSLKQAIDNEKTELDFMLILSFALYAFTLECLALQFFGVHIPLLPLHYLVLFILAFGAYRVGAVKAIGWAQAVLMAFDQEQDALRKKLGMQSFENRNTARKQWNLLSRHLLYGAGALQSKVDQIFDQAEKPAPASANASASSNVSILFQHEKVTLREATTAGFASNQGVHHYESEIEYFVLVTNMIRENQFLGDLPDAVGVYVMIDEQRVPWMDEVPSAAGGWSASQISPNRLLWSLNRPLEPNETVLLAYSLPIVIWTAKAVDQDLSINPNTSSFQKDENVEGYRVKLEITNKGTSEITGGAVDVFHSSITDQLNYKSRHAVKLTNPTGYRYKPLTIRAGASIVWDRSIGPDQSANAK